MEHKVTDLAYLAGIVDGEGCITITENMKGGRNYYRLVLDITNTSYDLMQWLEDTFISGRFWFGISLGFIIFGMYNYLKSVNFCGVFN